MLSLGSLIVAGLLFLNSLLVLNEKRLLIPYGVTSADNGGMETPSPVKRAFAKQLESIRMVLTYPVILANMLTIVFYLILG
mmetsp:Transcript_7321/g.19007  ORF Transcript_7321/g.19007 Transcript_7321/m.19007 type:complete len:81 (+) Transcript_7321:137-379(+)